MITWPRGLLVVGTDTDVGKTRVAAAIARSWSVAGHRVGVIKPVSTGGIVRDGRLCSPDADALIASLTIEDALVPPPPHERVAPLIFPLPLAPPVAARAAGTPLEPNTIVAAVRGAVEWWVNTARAEFLIIEGVGGLLCPLADPTWSVADLAVHLDYPVLIVARRGLGTLNHTLLTVEAARNRGLRVVGVILNGATPPTDPQAEATNAAELAARLHPSMPILADWPYNPDAEATRPALQSGAWIELAQGPRVAPDPTLALPTKNWVALEGSPGHASESEIDLLVPGRSVWESSSSGELLHRPEPGELMGASPPSPTFFDLDFGARPAVASAQSSADSIDDAEDVAPPRRSSYLLASYASAVTLALIWTQLQNRRVPRAPQQRIVQAEAVPIEDFSATEGRLGDQSRRVQPAAPIPADRLIDLGQTRQVESLAIEPLAVERRDLILERVSLTGKTERRDGGKRSIVLRLRLQNRSTDQIFAPLDPAFVRNRADDVSETFLELDSGRKLYPGSLAVESEWSLSGQSLAVLRPGESREIFVSSEANAPPNVEHQAGTWRIKLRTGIDSTTEVGVRLPDRGPP